MKNLFNLNGLYYTIVEGLGSTGEVVLLNGVSIRRREFHFNTRTSGGGSIRNNRFFKHLTTDLRNNTRRALASLILVSAPFYTGCSVMKLSSFNCSFHHRRMELYFLRAAVTSAFVSTTSRAWKLIAHEVKHARGNRQWNFFFVTWCDLSNQRNSLVSLISFNYFIHFWLTLNDIVRPLQLHYRLYLRNIQTRVSINKRDEWSIQFKLQKRHHVRLAFLCSVKLALK